MTAVLLRPQVTWWVAPPAPRARSGSSRESSAGDGEGDALSPSSSSSPALLSCLTRLATSEAPPPLSCWQGAELPTLGFRDPVWPCPLPAERGGGSGAGGSAGEGSGSCVPGPNLLRRPLPLRRVSCCGRKAACRVHARPARIAGGRSVAATEVAGADPRPPRRRGEDGRAISSVPTTARPQPRQTGGRFARRGRARHSPQLLARQVGLAFSSPAPPHLWGFAPLRGEGSKDRRAPTSQRVQRGAAGPPCWQAAVTRHFGGKSRHPPPAAA